ncbi:hypothetical protein RDWZM_009250 [Blomia tropicalis]|uniref:Uncharacterized protein n=1 Tax=Blomia tropicalis TaxID=40697 RepID=A0A9Q0RJJ9_BLOTA|nr:hypothetical protein RDWZM_009250 [Blomia tropicalis]
MARKSGKKQYLSSANDDSNNCSTLDKVKTLRKKSTSSGKNNDLKFTINLKKLSEDCVNSNESSQPEMDEKLKQLSNTINRSMCTRSMARANLNTFSKDPRSSSSTISLKVKLNTKLNEKRFKRNKELNHCDTIKRDKSPNSNVQRIKPLPSNDDQGTEQSEKLTNNKSLAIKLSQTLLTKLSFCDECDSNTNAVQKHYVKKSKKRLKFKEKNSKSKRKCK